MTSLVRDIPAAPSAIALMHFSNRLTFETDCSDVFSSQEAGEIDFVLVDVRGPLAFERGHVPGAVSFPHKLMTAESTLALSKEVVYVTYCDGIGCNGSTQGAYKLAKLGFHVKEMIGGLDFWIRDNHPLATGEERGNYSLSLAPDDCGCA